MSGCRRRLPARGDVPGQTLFWGRLSLGLTAAYAVYNGCLGLRYGAIWNRAVCVYYLLMSLVRAMLLAGQKRAGALGKEARLPFLRRVAVGAHGVLLLINLSRAAPAALMVLNRRPVALGEIAGITIAAYTTCRVAMAVVNLRRAGRRGEPLIRELRTVGMVDALVSLLTLQNTLIAIHADGRSMAGLTAWTSGGILLVILAVTVSSFYQAARPGKH